MRSGRSPSSTTSRSPSRATATPSSAPCPTSTSPPPPPPPPPSYIQLTGPINALGDGNITVQGEHEPVTCAIPDGADLSAFHVADYVAMKCVVTDDGLRLKRLQSYSAFWEAT